MWEVEEFPLDALSFQYKVGARQIVNSFIKHFVKAGLGFKVLGYRNKESHGLLPFFFLSQNSILFLIDRNHAKDLYFLTLQHNVSMEYFLL